MASSTIDLEFADGSYTFALPLERIGELQQKAGCGIGKLFGRVTAGVTRVGDDIILAPGSAEFYALDLIETIRQGLIGGGKGLVDGAEIKVTPIVAQRLVANYVLNRPLAEVWEHAVSILGATMVGYDPPGEAEPGGSPAKTTTAP
jgi:hypothetical protein